MLSLATGVNPSTGVILHSNGVASTASQGAAGEVFALGILLQHRVRSGHVKILGGHHIYFSSTGLLKLVYLRNVPYVTYFRETCRGRKKSVRDAAKRPYYPHDIYYRHCIRGDVEISTSRVGISLFLPSSSVENQTTAMRLLSIWSTAHHKEAPRRSTRPLTRTV